MQRAEITGAGLPLGVTDNPVPAAPPAGLLLRTLYAGVCHTDLHLIHDNVDLGDGKAWRHRDVLGEKFVGVVPGHEIYGEVAALGSAVPTDSGLKIGDRVLIYPWRGCRQCALCKGEQFHMCIDNQGTTTDIGKGLNPGGYQSHIPVPEWQLAVPAPQHLPPQVSCLLPCSAITSYNALEKVRESVERALATRGEAVVLIVGAGGLGIWATLLLKIIYRGQQVRVVCADVSEARLAGARSVGADRGLVWSRDASEDDLVALTTGEVGTVDAALDFVGLPKTFRAAFYCLINGGTLVPLGFAGGQGILPIPHIIGRAIAIRGSRVGSIAQLRTVVKLMEGKNTDNLPPVELYRLEEVNTVLDKLRAGEIKGRAVFKFDD